MKFLVIRDCFILEMELFRSNIVYEYICFSNGLISRDYETLVKASKRFFVWNTEDFIAEKIVSFPISIISLCYDEIAR